jgi:lipoteichoic acid synthase
VNILRSSRGLLSRRDSYYLLSLLVPFVVYNLSLKAASVLLQPGEGGFALPLDLMLSDIFFSLGYALLWISLFAATREGPLRWPIVILFHAATMLVVLVTTSAYLHLQQTGATLDYHTIAGWVAEYGEITALPAHAIPPSNWGLLAVALLYAAFGPLVVTRAIERRRRRLGRSPDEAPGSISSASSLVLLLLAITLGSLSLLTGATAFARDPLVNVVLTGVQEATTGEAEEATIEETGATEATTEEEEVEDTALEAGEPGGADSATWRPPPTYASLVPSSQTEKRNVVLIHLESTRARSVTPYNEDLNTTPFLNELSKNSLLTELTHVVVPRSSKGSTATNCGIEPALFPGPEFYPGGIPAPCLPSLLKQQGYRTVYFQSVSNASNSYWDDDLARNFGYDEFYSPEFMNREGFQETNTFGYEEDIMLGPSEGWLRANGYDRPFLAQYFTGTGHYGYECVPNRYGYERFSENEELDRYHNCLRMLDHFLENLINQYKALGLYENTIFVMYGDHGEGFREHGRYMHGDNPYEEGLHVPLLIHAPGWFEGGERATGLSNQIDVLPTVVEMLGYEVANGEYPGYSLLHSLPENRTLMSSCVFPYRCMASLKGTEKYIYHYGDQPEELYDLSKDPLEQTNRAGERDQKELDERREELLAWAASVDAGYAGFTEAPP